MASEPNILGLHALNELEKSVPASPAEVEPYDLSIPDNEDEESVSCPAPMAASESMSNSGKNHEDYETEQENDAKSAPVSPRYEDISGDNVGHDREPFDQDNNESFEHASVANVNTEAASYEENHDHDKSEQDNEEKSAHACAANIEAESAFHEEGYHDHDMPEPDNHVTPSKDKDADGATTDMKDTNANTTIATDVNTGDKESTMGDIGNIEDCLDSPSRLVGTAAATAEANPSDVANVFNDQMDLDFLQSDSGFNNSVDNSMLPDLGGVPTDQMDSDKQQPDFANLGSLGNKMDVSDNRGPPEGEASTSFQVLDYSNGLPSLSNSAILANTRTSVPEVIDLDAYVPQNVLPADNEPRIKQEPAKSTLGFDDQNPASSASQLLDAEETENPNGSSSATGTHFAGSKPNISRGMFESRRKRVAEQKKQPSEAKKFEMLFAATQARAQKQSGNSTYPSPIAPDEGSGEPIFEEDFGTPEVDTSLRQDPDLIADRLRLLQKMKSGPLNVDEDIKLRKLEAAEYKRLQLAKSRKELEKSEREKQQRQADTRGDSLFFEQNTHPGGLPNTSSDSSDEGLNPNKRPADDMPLSDTEGRPKKKRSKQTTKRRNVNKIPAAELRDSMAAGFEAGSIRDKSSKKKQAPKSRKSDKETKKRGKAKKGPEMTNIRSLYSGNVIDAAQANRNAAPQPTFSSKNKSNALAELIASIPEEDRKTSNADKNALLSATKKFTRPMKADGGGGWKLKGMISSLFHYQLLGAAFMRERERGSARPYGGFQADEMGFGKTVMMIANILDDKPLDHDSCKTTLIVCTPGLTTQWLNEILKHVEPGALGEVIKYHSGARIQSTDPILSLQKCDIVITTYNEVRASYPTCRPPLELATEESKNKWWKEYYNKNAGALHKIFFRRIVLDEAQAIKNADSKTSIAVRGLSGKYRWAISGTPIQNSIEELFPYFRFLKVKHTGSIDTFRQNYVATKDTIGLERLHSMLRTMMIRRTHLDQIFGRPILKLPDIERRTIDVEFNDVERSIYQIVKTRFCQRINTYSKNGTLESNYRHIFAMMLALRMLTTHVLLVQKILKELLQVEDIENLMVLTSKELSPTDPNRAHLDELKRIIAKERNRKLPGAAVRQATPRPSDGNTPPITPVEESSNRGGPFGATYEFRRIIQALYRSSKWQELTARSLCHKCCQPPEEPWITDCLHLYCKECLEGIQYEAATKDESRATCKECARVFEQSYPAKGIKELEYAYQGRTPLGREASIDSNGRRKGKAKDEDDLDWITEIDGHLLPSSKVMAVKVQVMEWLKEDPSVKIIVFTQFLDCIRILSRMCNSEQWGWCQFTGKMNFESRDNAVKTFRDDPEKKLLLCSLKAGGIGLNLTMASKVIILDLYWNESIEQQAFCRAFRIGQENMVEVVRFVIKNSIDTDMLLMQARKSKEIDAVIGDSRTTTKYTVQELMRLFGPVQEDEFGQEFIWVEDEPDNDDGEIQELTVPPRPR